MKRDNAIFDIIERERQRQMKGIERIRKKREETAARIAHILERIGSDGAEEYVALQKLIISASEDGEV